jgi:hypothetical protein
MEVERSAWSGEGDFTARLLEVLQRFDEIAAIRVEDAPASRSGTGYALLANEIFILFATERRRQRFRWLGILPLTRSVDAPRLTLDGLASRLAGVEEIGPPDYSDDGMLQYMRTERIVAPYQTRGYKLVELVRIY